METFIKLARLGSALGRSKIDAKRGEITAKVKAAKAAGKKGVAKGGAPSGGRGGGRGKGRGKVAASDEPGGSEVAAALDAEG